MATALSRSGNLHLVVGLSNSERSDALRMPSGGPLTCISVVSGGGSGFNGGTATVQVSLDGSTWFTASDLQGTDITFTADGMAELSTAAAYVAVLNDANVSDVDVTFLIQGL